MNICDANRGAVEVDIALDVGCDPSASVSNSNPQHVTGWVVFGDKKVGRVRPCRTHDHAAEICVSVQEAGHCDAPVRSERDSGGIPAIVRSLRAFHPEQAAVWSALAEKRAAWCRWQSYTAEHGRSG